MKHIIDILYSKTELPITTNIHSNIYCITREKIDFDLFIFIVSNFNSLNFNLRDNFVRDIFIDKRVFTEWYCDV